MAHRPRRLLVVALPLLLATVACGGDGKGSGAPLPTFVIPHSVLSGTPTTAPASSGGATPSSGKTGDPSGSAGSSTAPSGSTGTTTGTPKPANPSSFPVYIRLAKSCVRPGDTQTAVVTVIPGATVVIDTVYSDKKEGSVHGGLGHGTANAQGKYTYSWQVKVGTPPGNAATVARAGKDGRRGQGLARFTVALTC